MAGEPSGDTEGNRVKMYTTMASTPRQTNTARKINPTIHACCGLGALSLLLPVVELSIVVVVVVIELSVVEPSVVDDDEDEEDEDEVSPTVVAVVVVVVVVSVSFSQSTPKSMY